MSARTSSVSGIVRPEPLSGCEVDDKIEVGRLLGGQVFWLDAAKDLDKQTRRLPIDQSKTWAIPDQTTLFRHFGPFVDRRQSLRCGALDGQARQLKENNGPVSTFNAAAPDALALFMAGAIWSGAPALARRLDAVRTGGVLKCL